MSERITAEQIARIRQLDADRTPGPWLWEVAESDFEIMVDDKHNRHIAITTAGCNAAFIVAAANAIAPALDEIERLRQKVKEQDAEIDRLHAELRAIVRSFLDEEFFDLLDGYGAGDERKCILCGGKADIAWDEDDDGNRFVDSEFCSVAHTETCPIGQAKQIVARLEGA